MPQFTMPDERDRHVQGLQDQSPEAFAPDALDALGEVVENADGSATVALPEEETREASFNENMAEVLDNHWLRQFATELIELIKHDKDSRQERDKQYEDGIRRTGLGEDAPGGADFEGSSKVVHPMLAEACVDFSARAMKELCPANGPVKTRIFNAADTKVLDRAKKKRDYLNHLFTVEIEEYYPEKSQLFTQLPLGGSQYEKFWFDESQGRICMEFVPVDDVYLPFAASSFYTAQRITHAQKITRQTYEERVASGLYRDLETIPRLSNEPEQSAAEAATDKIEGRAATGFNEDGVRLAYEVSCSWNIEDDTFKPENKNGEYVVHIDVDTGEVLGLYRNWTEGDPKVKRIQWWVEDSFIPWRGVYGIGLPQLIGSLSGAATGALRAILDAAFIQNQPGALKLKGGRNSGRNINIVTAGLTEIDSAGADDIRKVVMPMPFNGPSVVLVQMLEWITTQAKGVIATAEEKIADAGNNMPVGTAMALLEQGSQVFSSIHARLHSSQQRAMRIVCRLIYQNGKDEELARWGLSREDFKDDSDIEPVSDPRIFSEAQRYAQLQEEFKVVGLVPNLDWRLKPLARRALELLRVDHIDEILPKDPEPITSDPVQENQAALLGAPLRAAPQQDHMAHMRAHLSLIANPFVLTMFDPQPLSSILQHCKEHFAMHYGMMAQSAAQQTLKIVVENGQQVTPDRMASLASQQALEQSSGELMQMAEGLKAIQEQIKAKLPPEPMDAGNAAFKAAMAEVERKKALDAANSDLKAKELDLKPLLEKLNGEVQASITVLKEQFSLLRNAQDNEQHRITELTKNHQDNITQIRVAMENNLKSALDGLQQQFQTSIAQSATPQTDNKIDALLQTMQKLLELNSAETEFITGENGELIGARRKM